MATWFTSDLHIGHWRVAKERGFHHFDRSDGKYYADEDAHDAALAEAWDSRVKPEDDVWVLGDISCGGWPAAWDAITWVGNRPGRKFLIWGNHDFGFPSSQRAHLYGRRYVGEDGAFFSASLASSLQIADQRVLLSHMPYAGDHGEQEDRHTQWRLRDEGRWLIHGHTHSDVKQDGRMLNVCPEAWNLAPVPLKEIEARVWDLANA